ncbi:MAG: hypothetical protein IJ400_06740 [Clostridia bacterium]|nr:hypothetical protein [Clostridia bacterium]
MKKKILIALAVLALVVCVFASCGGCEHNFVANDETNTATCTEPGQVTHVCSLCGAEEVRDSTAKGHNLDTVNYTEVKATCMTGGYTEVKCLDCDYTERQRETNPDKTNGHKYAPDTAPATCLTPGWETSICELCEQEGYDGKVLPELGHTYERLEPTGIEIILPKCEVDGYVVYTCQDPTCNETVNGYTVTKEIKDLEAGTDDDKALAATLIALEHEFTVKVDAESVAPTCTTVGYIMYACANGCDAEHVKSADIPALGHTYDRVDGTQVYVTTLEPTCCDEGLEKAKCQECETFSETYQNVLPEVAHFTGKGGDSYTGVTYHAATCTTDSYWDVKCTLDPDCIYPGTRADLLDEEKAENPDKPFVAALKHDWVLDESVLTAGQPTCYTEGHWQFKCSRDCGVDTAYEVELQADPDYANVTDKTPIEAKHTYVLGEYKVGPTCVTRGVYTCTNTLCGKDFTSYDDDVIYDYHENNDIVHSSEYIAENGVIAPTCHSEGYTIYVCNNDPNCPYTEKGSYVAKTNHNFAAVTDDGVLTCTDINCKLSYINITTVKDKTVSDFCLCGKCEDTVTCGGSITSIGTTKPTAPEALTAETTYTKTLDADSNLGLGLIELKGVAGTTYTVKVYNTAGEEITDLLTSLNVSNENGATAYICLYEVEDVAKVEITASADATVSFYKIVND